MLIRVFIARSDTSKKWKTQLQRRVAPDRCGRWHSWWHGGKVYKVSLQTVVGSSGFLEMVGGRWADLRLLLLLLALSNNNSSRAFQLAQPGSDEAHHQHHHHHEHNHEKDHGHDHEHKEGENLSGVISDIFEEGEARSGKVASEVLEDAVARGGVDFSSAEIVTEEDGTVKQCVEKEEMREEYRRVDIWAIIINSQNKTSTKRFIWKFEWKACF